MQENKKKTLAILFILIVIVAMSAVTYAFFMTGVNNNNAQEISVEAGTMKLTFSDADEGVSEHLMFGESVTKLFTLENTGTLEATANIYWNNLVNTYLPGSLVYKLEYTTSESEEKVVAIESQNVPRSEEPTQDILAYQQTVPSGVTYNYILTITLVHSDTVDQTRDLEAIFASGFTIQAVEKLDEPTLAAADTWYTQGGTSIARSSITSIDIVDSYDTTGKTIVDRWDASTEWDGSTTDDSGPVTAYIEDDGTGSAYKLTLAGNGYGRIYANADSSFAFYNYSNLTSISGLNLLNTSKATNMKGTFAYNSLLKILDLSNWDVGNVIDMSGMFTGSKSSPMILTTIGDIGNWNVSKVEDMCAMFQYCTQLTQLDLSKWNTEKVTDMSYMFWNCTLLTKLDLTNWNVSKVEDMSCMVAAYSEDGTARMSITTIGDTSKWDTSNVTTMKAMFQNCSSLKEVYVSAWNTENVLDMSYMFNGCSSLATLDVSNWNTEKATVMRSMFRNCKAIKELDLSNFNTKQVSNMLYIFDGMTGLEKVTLGANFSFTGNGSTSSVLPTPASGYWYNSQGTQYTPENVPSLTADTYYAIMST